MNNADSKNIAYKAPEMTVYGNITQITRAGESGSRFDGSFTQGQPVPGIGENDNQPDIFS